jgi:hypothetical protein
VQVQILRKMGNHASSQRHLSPHFSYRELSPSSSYENPPPPSYEEAIASAPPTSFSFGDTGDVMRPGDSMHLGDGINHCHAFQTMMAHHIARIDKKIDEEAYLELCGRQTWNVSR